MKISNVLKLFLISGTISLLCKCQKVTDIKKPNILFIITDDQSPYSLKSYGNQICQTPNIDRIAEKGMVITSSYIMGSWRAAVCVPSRMQIMTGRHVWRTLGLPASRTENFGSSSEAIAALRPEYPQFNSMPAVFKRAGYITFRTCKPTTSYGNANVLFDYNYERWCVRAEDEKGSKWHGDRAIDFLEMRASQNKNQPFLMYLGFSHPHDPRHGKEELYNKYGASDEPPELPDPQAPPLPTNYLPRHPFKHGDDNVRDETEVQGVMKRRDEAVIRNEIGRMYACIENLDMHIGRVLDKLEETGELDNTYIFFTGDNGIAVGRHGLVGKQNLYEHSWRVPLIVRGPGIKAGSRAVGNTYLMDVLPTMCDMAEIDIPQSCDGKSFLPVLKGESETIRDVLYGVYNVVQQKLGGPGNGSRPGIRAVRKGDWKLIKYDVYDSQVQETQLFNLKDNPFELLIEHHEPFVIKLTGNKPRPDQINLATDKKYKDKLQEMEKLLLEQQLKYQDPYRLWDQPRL